MSVIPRPPGPTPLVPQVTEAARQIVALRMTEADAEQALDALRSFREPWERFVLVLRPMIQAWANRPWPLHNPEFGPQVRRADGDRLDLKTRVGAVFLNSLIPDPLGELLRANFLQPNDGTVYRVFGHLGGPGIIDPDRFEWVVSESGALLNAQERELKERRDRAHRQADLLQQQLDAERDHELARLEREHWSLKGLWRRLTASAIGKVATWTVVTLVGGILTAYGVPALVRVALAIVAWIQARLP